MIDDKLRTLLAIMRLGSYTRAAEALSLSQPAVSYHIRQLEEENDIKIFFQYKKSPVLTPEGEVLVKYARRLDNIAQNAKRALLDCKQSLRHFTVGLTPTVGESLVSRVFAAYCNEHEHTHISILTDTIESLYEKLKSYELDWAIVEGSMPVKHCRTMLLDMDYLSLAVSPAHPFARLRSVTLSQLRSERLILRSENAGTRRLFEAILSKHQSTIRDFNVILEIDSVGVIKELVESNLGVTIMAYSAFRAEEAAGVLIPVPIDDVKMVREINIVCQDDFGHDEVLSEIKRLYAARPNGVETRF